MLVLISPAKTLDYDSPLATEQFSQPALLDESAKLIRLCQSLTPAQLASLMKISDTLAGLNAARFAQWHPEFDLHNARQAVLAFKGDVYTGLAAERISGGGFCFGVAGRRQLAGMVCDSLRASDGASMLLPTAKMIQ